MKKSTLILLTAAALLLSGCVSDKIDGVNPTAPPAKLVKAGWKSSWSPDGRQLVHKPLGVVQNVASKDPLKTCTICL